MKLFIVDGVKILDEITIAEPTGISEEVVRVKLLLPLLLAVTLITEPLTEKGELVRVTLLAAVGNYT